MTAFNDQEGDQFFPFLRRIHPSFRDQAADAATISDDDCCCDSGGLPRLSSNSTEAQKFPFSSKRGLLLVASACSLVVAGAAVCGLLPSGGTLLHATTTTPIATTAAADAGGDRDGGDRQAFSGGHAFVPVPRLQNHGAYRAPANAAAAAGSTNKQRRGRRKLNVADDNARVSSSSSSSTPHAAAPLAFDGAVEGSTSAGYREAAEATVEEADAGAENAGGGTKKTAGGQGGRDAGSRPPSSRPLGENQPDRNPALAAAAAAATRRRTTALEMEPQGQSERERAGSSVPDTQDFAAAGGESVCSPLEVVGLGDCPEMSPDAEGGDVGSNAIVKKLLDAKADMLRQVIEVLTDPASSGRGGKQDEPLLLVQKLAVDETDAIFGAYEKRFLRHTADASSWSPLPGGFNRWVELYYRKVLRQTRPVLITVHGDDVCALEKELSVEARLKAAGAEESDIEKALEGVPPASALAQARRQTVQHRRRMASNPGHHPGGGQSGVDKHNLNPHFGEGMEDFEVPVVLMTVGWDPAGDPTHKEDRLGRDRECAYRMLKSHRVVRWFTSHTRYDSHTDEKFRYLPIGFGGYETRNGLPHTAYIDAARHQLNILESCPVGETGSYDLLFQCNTLDRDPRPIIWKQMTEGKGPGSPIPVNRAPLEAAEMVTATAKGIFAVSPPGTGPDCFRHYEMMLEGNIALVPDVYSMRRFMEGLPAFFFGKDEGWDSLTCGRLLEMAEDVQARIKEGKENKGGGLQFEKLTHGFWRRYMRREILRAGGVTDESALETYVERSSKPLNPHGWTTFRRVGCFYREEEPDPQQQGLQQHTHFKQRHEDHDPHRQLYLGEPVVLRYADRTPKGCARHCSVKKGGGIGFFGISNGDACWCDKVPGSFLPLNKCNIDCDGEHGTGRCGGDYASSVYVFGPADKGAPFEYMGCFPSTEYVMFHAAVRLGKASTPFVCEAFCTSIRYPFFALEASDLCRCGVMPANSPRSDKVPAFIKGGGYEPIGGPPNATLAAKPVPEGVRVGDARFQCHKGRCGGNSKMWGCGADKAYDLYKNSNPCVLFRDCHANSDRTKNIWHV